MKSIAIMFVFFFFLPFSLFAQDTCSTKELSVIEKRSIMNLWSELRIAITQNNRKKALKIFNLPFTCSFCDISSEKPYIIINDSKSFDTFYFKTLRSKNFMQVLNSNDVMQILHGDIQENGKCVYSFSFPIVKPSKNREGLQGFLNFIKINGKYKISAAWSVP
jgi:predicted CDP-diglyceride synthetase/phosphatidate cytidylyltransferase